MISFAVGKEGSVNETPVIACDPFVATDCVLVGTLIASGPATETGMLFVTF